MDIIINWILRSQSRRPHEKSWQVSFEDKAYFGSCRRMKRPSFSFTNLLVEKHAPTFQQGESVTEKLVFFSSPHGQIKRVQRNLSRWVRYLSRALRLFVRHFLFVRHLTTEVNKTNGTSVEYSAYSWRYRLAYCETKPLLTSPSFFRLPRRCGFHSWAYCVPQSTECHLKCDSCARGWAECRLGLWTNLSPSNM